MTEITVSHDMLKLRDEAKRQINFDCELERRRRFVAWGDGQQQEYRDTAEEAQRIKNDDAPEDADYPNLAAERDAQNEALGARKTLDEIGAEVRQRVADLRAEEARLKKVRRKAKLLVDQAQSPPEIDQAKDIDWQKV